MKKTLFIILFGGIFTVVSAQPDTTRFLNNFDIDQMDMSEMQGMEFEEISEGLEHDCGSWSLDLPSSNYGLSFGNSRTFTGIRFNWRDCGIEQINGINITFWQPYQNPNSSVNGLSFGVSPMASYLNGVNLGLGAVVGSKGLNGINLGLLAGVTGGTMNGINMSSLALVSGKGMNFFNFGGLAVVSGKYMYGANFGGLAAVAGEEMGGINAGGLALVGGRGVFGINYGTLAIVSGRELAGVNFSGLANVSGRNMTGLNVSGIAQVSGGVIGGLNLSGIAMVGAKGIYGINLSGVALVADNDGINGFNFALGKIHSRTSINGITIGGYSTEAAVYNGINITVGWTQLYDLNGLSVSVWNDFYGEQTGIAIGLLNIAKVLNGVQIGLINIAENNPAPFKILPFINMHF